MLRTKNRNDEIFIGKGPSKLKHMNKKSGDAVCMCVSVCLLGTTSALMAKEMAAPR